MHIIPLCVATQMEWWFIAGGAYRPVVNRKHAKQDWDLIIMKILLCCEPRQSVLNGSEDLNEEWETTAEVLDSREAIKEFLKAW